MGYKYMRHQRWLRSCGVEEPLEGALQLNLLHNSRLIGCNALAKKSPNMEFDRLTLFDILVFNLAFHTLHHLVDC